MAKAEIFTKT